MSPDEFNQWGHKAVDWIAKYLDTVENHPVLAQVELGDIRRRLPSAPPELGDRMEDIFEDLDQVILQGFTH